MRTALLSLFLTAQAAFAQFDTGLLLLLTPPAAGGGGSSLNTSLISYWKMDEASGNRADSGGSSQTLTDTTTVPSATGILNNGGDFEFSAPENMAHADSAALSVADQDFSLTCWVKLESKPAFDGGIISKQGVGDNANDEYGLVWDGSTDRFNFTGGNGSSAGTVTASTFGAPSTATWYFIACGYDAAANNLWISVDDGTVDTAGFSPGPSDNAANGAFTVGGKTFNVGFAFDGVIDEIGFWKKKLSAAEITTLRGGGTPPACCPF